MAEKDENNLWVKTPDIKKATKLNEKTIKDNIRQSDVEPVKRHGANYYRINDLDIVFPNYIESLKEFAGSLPNPKTPPESSQTQAQTQGKQVQGIEILEEEQEEKGEEEEEEKEEGGGESPEVYSGEVEEESEELTDKIYVSRKLRLAPDILILFSLYRNNGGNLSIDQFVNQCVRKVMEDMGYEVIVSTPEVE